MSCCKIFLSFLFLMIATIVNYKVFIVFFVGFSRPSCQKRVSLVAWYKFLCRRPSTSRYHDPTMQCCWHKKRMIGTHGPLPYTLTLVWCPMSFTNIKILVNMLCYLKYKTCFHRGIGWSLVIVTIKLIQSEWYLLWQRLSCSLR